MKHCNKCGQDKPPVAFYKTNSHCKECVKAQQRKDYHADLETSRLQKNLAYNTPEVLEARRLRGVESPKKEIRRKAKDFMARYMPKEPE